MAIIKPDKSNSIVVLAHQAVTHPVTVVGSSIDVVTKRSVTIFLYHGYVEAVADTDPGRFIIQLRPNPGAGSENEDWVDGPEYVVRGTTPDSEAISGTEAIGQTVIEVASTTGFAALDQLYIQDTGVITDGEWAKCLRFVAGVSIDLMDGLTVAKDSSDIIFNDAIEFISPLNVTAIESYRVIWSHEGATGANGHIKAFAVTHDSDTST